MRALQGSPTVKVFNLTWACFIFFLCFCTGVLCQVRLKESATELGHPHKPTWWPCILSGFSLTTNMGVGWIHNPQEVCGMTGAHLME
jgi:hypothetical protein